MPHSTAQQHQGCTLHETSVSGSRTTCSHTHIHKYTQVHHNVPRSVVCRANTSGLLPRQPYRCWDHFRLCQRRSEVSGEPLHEQWHTRRSIRTGVGNLQSSQRPGIREFVNRSNACMRSVSSLHHHAGTVRATLQEPSPPKRTWQLPLCRTHTQIDSSRCGGTPHG